jgi:hypothetical protein
MIRLPIIKQDPGGRRFPIDLKYPPFHHKLLPRFPPTFTGIHGIDLCRLPDVHILAGLASSAYDETVCLGHG